MTDTEEDLPVNLRRSAAVMAAGTTISRITGLGRLVAMAFALGVAESRLADSYNIANTMPNVLYELVLGGVLTSVFIPVVVEELRRRRGDDAWDAVSTVATTTMAVLVVVSVVAALAAPWIVRIFTLRLSGAEAAQQQELATFFLRFFAPQIALYGVAAISAGLLNAHDRFAVPMFAPILNNLIVIATFLAFAAIFSGLPTDASVADDTGARLLLALGTTAGVAGMALAHWPAVRRLPGRLKLRLDFRHPAVRKLGRLSLWTVGYVVSNQLSFGIALYLANQVQGGPTAFFVAFAFFQLPYGIVAVSIITALVPRLSTQAVEGDSRGFQASIGGGLRAMAVVLVPATAAFLVLAQPLVQTLLEHGVMGSTSRDLVAGVLVMFSVGLLPFSAFLFFLRAFYARQDARTPTLINLAANACYALFAVALFPSMEVEGIALAHSLSYVVGAVLAGVLMSRRLGVRAWGPTAGEIGKVAVASAAAAAAMALVSAGVAELVVAGSWRAVAQTAGGGAAGLVVFAAAARILRVEELNSMRRLLPGGGRLR